MDIKDYRGEILSLKAIVTTLRATIEARDAEIVDLKHDTDDLIRKWRMVNIRADAAEARVKELEEEYSGNCVHCGSLVAPDDRNHWERCDKHPANDHIAVLGRDLTAMTSRYSRAATDIASLEAENAALRERVDEYRTRKEELIDENAALRELICVLEKNPNFNIDDAIDVGKEE